MKKTKNEPYPDGNGFTLSLQFWNMSRETCVMMMVQPNWTKPFGRFWGCGLSWSGWFERVVVFGIPCGNYGMWMKRRWWRSRELHKELKQHSTDNLRHTNVWWRCSCWCGVKIIQPLLQIMFFFLLIEFNSYYFY